MSLVSHLEANLQFNKIFPFLLVLPDLYIVPILLFPPKLSPQVFALPNLPPHLGNCLYSLGFQCHLLTTSKFTYQALLLL